MLQGADGAAKDLVRLIFRAAVDDDFLTEIDGGVIEGEPGILAGTAFDAAEGHLEGRQSAFALVHLHGLHEVAQVVQLLPVQADGGPCSFRG